MTPPFAYGEPRPWVNKLWAHPFWQWVRRLHQHKPVDPWAMPWHCAYCGSAVEDFVVLSDDLVSMTCAECSIASEVRLLN